MSDHERNYVLSLLWHPGDEREQPLERLVSVPEVRPEQITHPKIRELLTFILECASKQMPVSAKLASQQSAQIEEDWLLAEMEQVDPEGIFLYAEGVLKAAEARALAQAQNLDVSGLATPEAVDALQRKLAQIELIAEKDKIVTAAEANRRFVVAMRERQEYMRSGKPRFAFQANIDSLNKFATYIMPGEVVLLSAKTSIGKTTCAHDLFDSNLKRDIGGALFHFEDNPLVVGYRQAAREMSRETDDEGHSSGVPYTRMLSSIMTQDELDHIEHVMKRSEEWAERGFRIHCPGWTMAQLCRKWRGLAMKHDNFQFVVIDYFGKQRLSRESLKLLGSVPNVLEEDFELIKTTAELTDTIAVVAQQESETSDAVHNVFGTKTSRQKSQVCLSITRERDHRTKELAMEGEMVLTKVSNGRLGSVPVELLPDWMLFVEQGKTRR